MSEPTQPTPDELAAEQTKLQKRLAELTAMEQEGLPVAEALAQVKQQVADLKHQLATVGDQSPVFDQRNQEVERQVNVGRDYIDRRQYIVEPAPDNRAEAARQRYLRRLQQRCQALPLASLGGEEGADQDMTLDHVYIQLDTTSTIPLTEAEKAARQESKQDALLGRQVDERPLAALEAAVQTSRLALLGDPGSGKSTFAHYLVVWLAAAGLGETEPPPGLPADLLPVFITLRDLSPRLAGLDLSGLSAERQAETLVGAVRDQAVADLARLEADDFAEGLQQALAGGRCLLVLDGLDETPHDLRPLLRRTVGAVISHYRPQRLILTCRVRSYQGETRLPDFEAYTLAPFDEAKVRQFARAWYTAQKELGRVDAEQARVKVDDLSQAALEDDLRELAENPMLLTTMAIIHQKEIGLPRERVRLYSLAVEVLLHRWQKRKTGEILTPSPALLDVFKDQMRLRWVMERLAYEAHQVGQADRQAADLPRGEALTLLEAPDYLGDAGLAAEFLDYVDQRAGLLVGRGGAPGRPALYSFPHRTFQEYLAGCYLIRQRSPAREIQARAGEGDYWAVAAQLAAEELLYNMGQRNDLLDLVYQLCPPGCEPATEQNRRAALWAGSMAARPGPDSIARDEAAPGGGESYLQHLQTIQATLLASDLPAPERAEAGRSLALLGDLRSGVGLREDGLPDIAWRDVAAGPFLMGSSQADEQAQDEEKPQHTLDLPAFRISKYPVTNAQYGVFVEAGGYQVAEYWPEAIQAGYWKNGQVRRRVYREGQIINEWAESPAKFGQIFGLRNHPVVGINWWEALAYCRWLTVQFQKIRELKANEMITLPSEAEWEKAARGPASGSQPGRVYPWGDEPDPNRANYKDTGIGATSAVGCFPGGASPYGCLDMAGNVWEWTKSLWGKDVFKPDFKYPYNPTDGRENLEAGDDALRVLRGGSWGYIQDYARCAFRDGSHPSGGYFFWGFRVLVVSPISASAL